jgi:hypothetical protein
MFACDLAVGVASIADTASALSQCGGNQRWEREKMRSFSHCMDERVVRKTNSNFICEQLL